MDIKESKEFRKINNKEYQIKTYEPKLERDFKGIWIPKEIWLDDKLNLLEKCLLV